MAVLTALISVIEIVFFAFIGDLVDWLAAADRATFLADHGSELIVMGLVVVVGFPLVSLFQNLLMFQTIYGNFPMLVRWKAHRYILGQSLEFFHNEFAGRVSQKVMQTALAVRETVTKVLDVFVYVVVYFIGTLYLVGRADLWLTLPLVLWLAAYVGILVYFIPRLQTRLDDPGRRARADDRPHRRQLHQHPDHQALRPYRSASRTMPATRWTSSWSPSTARCGW